MLAQGIYTIDMQASLFFLNFEAIHVDMYSMPHSGKNLSKDDSTR